MHSYELSGYPVFSFDHNAMATVFEIHLLTERSGYAAEAASEVFRLLDLIELELSRFIENSDIARINKLQTGESLIIGEHAFACIRQSIDYFHKTGGLFDIGIGREISQWKNGLTDQETPALPETGIASLQLNEAQYSVTLQGAAVEIDLGGVGKGYAIDYLMTVLREWGFDNYLIHGGQSTTLAKCDNKNLSGWPVSISHPSKPGELIANIVLKNNSMSSSGLQKGTHIIDPRSGLPVSAWLAAWVIAGNALESDVLATSFMIMDRGEIERYSAANNDISCLLISKDDQKLKYGDQLKTMLSR